MTERPSDVLTASRPQHPPHRPLTELADWLAAADATTRAHGDLGGVATGITLASQRVLPGDVYAALPGSHAHGVDYVAAAVEAGAVAVLTDTTGSRRVPEGVPVLQVAAPRSLLGRFAAHVYGDPARSLRMLGVTGTQGKTTTTRLAESALQLAGVRSAVVGTVGTRVDGEEIKTALTTPEAPDLHGLFAMMKERSVDRLRDGGLQPRPGAGPRRRRGLRPGRLHQPRSRPPRLPRRPRGLLPGQGLPVHPAALREGPGQCRRRARPEAPRPGRRSAAVVLRHRRRRRLACRGRAGDVARVGVPGDRPGGRARRGGLPAAR